MSSPSYKPGNMERRHSFHGPSTNRSFSIDRQPGSSVASVGLAPIRATSLRPPGGSVAFTAPKDRSSFGTVPPPGSPGKKSPGSMSQWERPGPGSPVMARGDSKQQTSPREHHPPIPDPTASWNRSNRRMSREPWNPPGQPPGRAPSVDVPTGFKRGSVASVESQRRSASFDYSQSTTHPSASSSSPFPESPIPKLSRQPALSRTTSEPRYAAGEMEQSDQPKFLPRSASEGPPVAQMRSRANTIAPSELSRERLHTMANDFATTARSRTMTIAHLPGTLVGSHETQQAGKRSASPSALRSQMRHPTSKYSEYDIGDEGSLPRDDEGAFIPKLKRATLKTGVYQYLPIDMARERTNDAEDMIENQTSVATLGPADSVEPNRSEVPLPLLVLLFVAWSYAAGAWVLGCVFPSASLDFLKGTSMHWHMTKSLVQTLTHLLEGGVYGGFFALAFFSVLVPVGKISATLLIIYKMTYESMETIQKDHMAILTVLGYLASYQFVDLYVGIMFVCFFNADASDADFDVGFYWFFSYCFCSICTSVFIENLFELYVPQEKDHQAAPISAKDGLLSSNHRPHTASHYSHHGPHGHRRTTSAATSASIQSSSPMHSGVSIGANGIEQVMIHVEDGMGPEGRSNSRFTSPFLDMQEVREVSSRMSRESDKSRERRKTEEVCENGHYMHPDAKYCSQCGRGRKENIVGQSSTPKTSIDSKITYFFSACYVVAAVSCFFFDLLEVRMLMNGIAIDRQAISLGEAMFIMLPVLAHPVVLIFLWLVTVIFPLLYIFSLLIQVTYTDHSSFAYRIGHYSTHHLRQWAMPDVVAVASLIFLFMIQDEHTLTMPPDGSCAYYLYLCASFSFFFIRWFSDSEPGDDNKTERALSTRFIVLSITYLLLCVVIFHGIPGQAPHFEYQSLGTVCKHTQPFLNKAVVMAPASYGNCKDTKSKPPHPCLGDKNLQTSESPNGEYMNAIWISGLRTTSFTNCKLDKRPADGSGQTHYRLQVGGAFGHLAMFLRVKSCSVLGCTRMNTAKNCCGRDLGFNFSFLMSCKPSRFNAIREVHFEKISIDPMIVSAKLMKGALKVDAMDISPQVENAISDQIEAMLKTHVPWGGKPLSLAQLLNKIVWYNSPSNAGTCY